MHQNMDGRTHRNEYTRRIHTATYVVTRQHTLPGIKKSFAKNETFYTFGVQFETHGQKAIPDRRTRTDLQDVLRIPATSYDQFEGCGHVDSFRIHQIHT